VPLEQVRAPARAPAQAVAEEEEAVAVAAAQAAPGPGLEFSSVAAAVQEAQLAWELAQPRCSVDN